MKRIFMLASLCVFMSHISCESGKEVKEVEARFLVTSPVRMDTTRTEEYVCQIHSIRNIELRALERGYLQEILVDEGQFVKKGQLMFQILPALYKAELQKTEAEAKVAEIEYLNTKLLADSNIVSQNELAMAAANYEKAKAEVSLARVHVGFTQIRAPFDGIMDRLHVREGSLIEEGELISTLSDNSQMWVYFNVPEPEYLDYRISLGNAASAKVDLMMANNKLFEYPGVVETIESEFNNETGNIAFRATFPNPKGLLRHGETGNILMHVPIENSLVIPQKATYEILDKKYVYVVDEENRIQSRQIIIGEELPHLYVVLEGLDEKDKILLEGLRKVRDRDEVAYDFEDPMTVLSQLVLPAE